MVLLIAPIYNADGNERFATDNRGRQNGPVGGQGQRPNAQNYDLNRDHMKLDSPEARAFVKLMTDYDPQVAMDLHTTNGSRHGYYLTYAPPLNPATDPVDHRPVAEGLAAIGHQDHQVQIQLGLLLLRQHRGARRRACVALVRRPSAFQQQLHRTAQSRGDPERGVRLRHLRGPHQGDEPVRRGSAELRPRARGADQEADGGRRSAVRRRIEARACAPRWKSQRTPSRSWSAK